jgi:hypothetical protein
MDEETNNDELNALHGDHKNNNNSSSGQQIWKLKIKIMNLSTNIEDNNIILPIVTL